MGRRDRIGGRGFRFNMDQIPLSQEARPPSITVHSSNVNRDLSLRCLSVHG